MVKYISYCQLQTNCGKHNALLKYEALGMIMCPSCKGWCNGLWMLNVTSLSDVFYCFQRGATIVYATHIFDGLETWATHLAYIQDGVLRRYEKLSDVSELKSSSNLLSVVESWLRAETKLEKKKPVNPASHVQKTSFGSSPFVSSRHMAYYR